MRVLEAFRFLKPKSRQRSSSRKGEESNEHDASSLEVSKEPEEPGLHAIPIDPVTDDRVGRQHYEVDVVAIHGLDGSPWGTWTHKDGTFWLRDTLPKDIPGARIFTYSYPSQLLWSQSEATIMDYTQSLLENLLVQRRNQQRRPIIFLAHSLGGIVCKEALIKAKNDPRFSVILESTVGILFFGTPHRGAETEMGVFLGNIINFSGAERINGKIRTDLLLTLQGNSVKLREVSEAFRHISSRFQIVTVYETKVHGKVGRLIVDQSSAQMYTEKEHLIPGYGSHTEICRFRRSTSSSDQVYQSVLYEILEMCNQEFSLTESERAYYGQFNDPAVDDYTSTILQPVAGTCEWILKSQEYRLWAQEPRTSMVWLTGHAGSGKSVLAKFITQHLEKDALPRDDTVVCSFFCNNEVSALKDARSLLRRVISQILKKYGELTKKAMSASDDDSSGHTLIESYDRLWSTFTTILHDVYASSVNIIIDALDECEETSRDRFMSDLAKLVDHSKLSSSKFLKIWITSRPYLSLNEYFMGFVPQRVALEDNGDDTDRDLRLVIKERVKDLAERLRLKQDTVNGIENHLIENADRTFLWVQFALELLKKSLLTVPGDFRRVLAGLPRKLEDTYTRFLHEIMDEDKDFARKILFAIIGSFWPLTLEELNVLISMSRSQQGNCNDLASLEKEYLHENIRIDIERVLGPLIKVSNSKVYLVHLSLKEFLCQRVIRTSDQAGPRREYIDTGHAHLMLAFACMAYLSFDDFTQNIYIKARSHNEHQSLASSETSIQRNNSQWSSPSSDTGEDDEPVDGYIFGNYREEFQTINQEVRATVKQHYTLFEYASMNWADHFANCQDLANENLKHLAIRLTNRRSHGRYSNWLRFHLARTLWGPGDAWSWDQFAIAGCFGHFVSLETLIEQTDSIRPESLSLALCWASRNGHEKCVVRLLKTNVVPDSCRPSKQSALCSAAVNGYTGIVKALATDPRVDINFKGWLGICPLSCAAFEGHLEIVDFLLRQERIDPNMQDDVGQTPLSSAISHGHSETALRLAKDRRVNVNYADGDGMRLIDIAAKGGKEEEVALLLQLPRVDVNTPSATGRTPLAEAAVSGHIASVEQLVRTRKLDKSHSHRDKDGRSAISLAAGKGFSDIITLLLGYQIPGVDEKDTIEEWTPLFWALEANRISTVKLLLNSKRVNVNHQDHTGRTPLFWAVSYGNEESLRLLLGAPEVDISIPDNEGLTPLDWADKSEIDPHMAKILEEMLRSKGRNDF